jgi:Leishmanolysin
MEMPGLNRLSVNVRVPSLQRNKKSPIGFSPSSFVVGSIDSFILESSSSMMGKRLTMRMTVLLAVAMVVSRLGACSVKAGDLGSIGTKSEEKVRNQLARRRVQSVRLSNSAEAVAIRQELRAIEERAQRSQTGFKVDPDHMVPYDDHPWDIVRDRSLQEDESQSAGTSSFQSMRIKFETQALDDMRDSSNGAKIDFVKNEILPRAAAFWSKALAVVPVSGNLRISTGELDNREYCGDYEFTRVPSEHISTGVEGTDLILYVSGTPSSRFCSYQTLVSASKSPPRPKATVIFLPVNVRRSHSSVSVPYNSLHMKGCGCCKYF